MSPPVGEIEVGTFPLDTEYRQSRPLFPPLILELRSLNRCTTYHDRWLFPDLDPARWVIPVPHSANQRFSLRFESPPDKGTGNDNWTMEYLVRQDWRDARVMVGHYSALPSTGENLSFRIKAIQSRDISAVPITLLKQSVSQWISNRAMLAQAFAEECPSEIASKLTKGVMVSEIRSELCQAASGAWLPTGVLNCEVSVDGEELSELQLLADRLSSLLSDRCTLGCQVVVECVPVDSNHT